MTIKCLSLTLTNRECYGYVQYLSALNCKRLEQYEVFFAPFSASLGSPCPASYFSKAGKELVENPLKLLPERGQDFS